MAKKRVKAKRVNYKRNSAENSLNLSIKILFFILIILILVLAYFLVQYYTIPNYSPSNVAVNYTGLSNGFTPSVAYYQNVSGRSVILWNSSGSYYMRNESGLNGPLTPSLDGLPLGNFIPVVGYVNPIINGITYFDSSGNFKVWMNGVWGNKVTPFGNGTDGHVPAGFKTVSGYYEGFGNGVHLFNSSGQTIIWNGSSWSVPFKLPNLPQGKAPVVTYYSFFDRPQTCEFWPIGDLNGDHVINSTDNNTLSIMVTQGIHGAPYLPIPLACGDLNGDGFVNATDQIYMNNILSKRDAGGSLKVSINLWYNDNGPKLYVANGSGKAIIKTTSGLPNALPTVGYFDGITNRVVLWYGTVAYQSADGLNFNPVFDSNSHVCTPSCSNVLCGSANGCGGTCDSGSSQCLAQDACIDSDISQSIPQYIAGNVSYINNGVRTIKYDSCLNILTVTEYFCSGNQQDSFNMGCLNNCSLGACQGTPSIACTDSDGGQNYSIYGSVNFTVDKMSQVFNDRCVSTTVLDEGYCDFNNYSQVIEHTCSNNQVCQSGACVNSGTGTTGSSQGAPCTSDICQGTYFIACANGQYLDPQQIDGQCNYSSSALTSGIGQNVDNGSSSQSTSSTNWILIVMIIVIILIIIVGAVIAYILIQKRKGNKPSGVPAPKPPALPPRPVQRQVG